MKSQVRKRKARARQAMEEKLASAMVIHLFNTSIFIFIVVVIWPVQYGGSLSHSDLYTFTLISPIVVIFSDIMLLNDITAAAISSIL